LVSFFLNLLSFGSGICGKSGEREDITEGDLVNTSSPRTKPLDGLSVGVSDAANFDLGSRCVRSSLAGFFLDFACDDAPSMSSSALAFSGSPLAMAELEVCCEMDRGTLDLS
jgi:hypothetical protein